MSEDMREAFKEWAQLGSDPYNITEIGRGVFHSGNTQNAWYGYQAATASTEAKWRGVVEKLVGALKIAQEAAECFPDVHDGRVEPLQIIEHLHEWESKYITFGQVAGAENAITEAEKMLGGK